MDGSHWSAGDSAEDSAGAAGRRSCGLSIVIPAYKEGKRLVRTLDAAASYLEARGGSYEILVVDDGSPDDTRAVALAWAGQRTLRYGQMRVLRYDQNRGKGFAVRYGVLRAVATQNVLFMDADLATPIEEIEKLEAALASGQYALAIGSRPLANSELLVRQPWYREMAGRLFNRVVQAAATPGIRDTQCGFKLMTAPAAQQIFSRCTLDGFSFDVEALLLARKLGYSVAEVPVRWAHQEGAAAFASSGAYLWHGMKMLADLASIRWVHRTVRPANSSVAVLSAHPPA